MHTPQPLFLSRRTAIVEFLLQLSTQLHLHQCTTYLAVSYMELLLATSTPITSLSYLRQVSLACLWTASKVKGDLLASPDEVQGIVKSALQPSLWV